MPPNLHSPAIEIGLVNNMPDAALEATELQFSTLLKNAAGPLSFRLRLFSLPEIERSQTARHKMAGRYGDLNELWDGNLDALIVTGAEPRTSDLRQEVYWDSLTKVADWAKTHVTASVWSCLAAHAAVLHLDGIARCRLPEKCCGVFEHRIEASHPLTQGLTPPLPAPHSRWNEVTRTTLESSGYEVLTCSTTAGVNLFTKQWDGLFVFWQGHPEYDERSLLKEYQRDVLRFLRREREVYPSMPQGYFTAMATEQLLAFQEHAQTAPQESLVSAFPFETAGEGLANTWLGSAIQVYSRWLQTVADRKTAR